jgi:CMP-N-acetylneuraminic acid synthetase
MKVLGIITARGGSKGIKRKNIVSLAGKPLIYYTIQAAKKSKLLTNFIVSTEDKKIAAIAKKYGASVPFLRPKKLAKDDTKSIDVIKNIIKKLEKNNEFYDAVIILQPTSPLRTGIDIDNAINKMIKTDADSIISLVNITGFALDRIKKIKNDIIYSFYKDEKEGIPRQKLDTLYKRNGAIYLTKTSVLKKGSIFGKSSRPYIMPAEKSVDINEEFDLLLTKFLMEKK